jgi:hypothetical protein
LQKVSTLLLQEPPLRAANRTRPPPVWSKAETTGGGKVMKGILLWLVGIPIPIIILLYLFGVF